MYFFLPVAVRSNASPRLPKSRSDNFLRPRSGPPKLALENEPPPPPPASSSSFGPVVLFQLRETTLVIQHLALHRQVFHLGRPSTGRGCSLRMPQSRAAEWAHPFFRSSHAALHLTLVRSGPQLLRPMNGRDEQLGAILHASDNVMRASSDRTCESRCRFDTARPLMMETNGNNFS